MEEQLALHSSLVQELGRQSPRILPRGVLPEEGTVTVKLRSGGGGVGDSSRTEGPEMQAVLQEAERVAGQTSAPMDLASLAMSWWKLGDPGHAAQPGRSQFPPLQALYSCHRALEQCKALFLKG